MGSKAKETLTTHSIPFRDLHRLICGVNPNNKHAAQSKSMKAIMRCGEPDRVPMWELIINEPTLSAWGAKSREEFVEMEDLDGITVSETIRREPLSEAERKELVARGCTVLGGTSQLVRDEWGIVWGMTGNGIPYPVEGPVRKRTDLKHFRPPDPDAPHRFEWLREVAKRFKGRRALVLITHDGFEFPHYLRGGMENLLVDYIENPQLAHEVAEIALDYKIQIMRRAVREGVDVVVSGDDYANAQGLMMSPKHFQTFILPYLKQAVEAAHDAGVPFIKHTDGNVMSILGQMVDAGIDGLDPIEPAAGMDIAEVKRLYGNFIAVLGNVDCSFVLPNGKREEVIDAVKETIAKASPGGGHVLASSNSIHPAVKPENYRTMIETGRQFGQYPIDPELIAAYRQRNYIQRYIVQK